MGSLHAPLPPCGPPRSPPAPAQGSPPYSSDMTTPHGLPCLSLNIRLLGPRLSSQVTCGSQTGGLGVHQAARGGAPSTRLRDHGSEPEAMPGMGRASRGPRQAQGRHPELRTGHRVGIHRAMWDGHRVGTGRAGIQTGQCRHRAGTGRVSTELRDGHRWAQGGQASTEAHSNRVGIHRVMGQGPASAWGLPGPAKYELGLLQGGLALGTVRGAQDVAAGQTGEGRGVKTRQLRE